MSGTRDRLGLLLPIPALLAGEPTAAHARSSDAPPASEPPGAADLGDSATRQGGSTEADEELQEILERCRRANEEGNYAEVGRLFEQAAALAPDLLPLRMNAAIAFGRAATADRNPDTASILCAATRRNVEALIAHPKATSEQRRQMLEESRRADDHCVALLDTAFGPCLSPPPPVEDEPPPIDDIPAADWSEVPADRLSEVRAIVQEGRRAFAEGAYHQAGVAFEQAAELAPKLPVLRVDASTAFRQAATHEYDPDLIMQACEFTQRNAKAVLGHPRATAQQRERAQGDWDWFDRSCTDFGPCLSVEPCLISMPPRRGCRRGDDGSLATFGALMLLGLRARRRRDAVERMADRLPPDVAAKLRHTDDAEPDG